MFSDHSKVLNVYCMYNTLVRFSMYCICTISGFQVSLDWSRWQLVGSARSRAFTSLNSVYREKSVAGIPRYYTKYVVRDTMRKYVTINKNYKASWAFNKFSSRFLVPCC